MNLTCGHQTDRSFAKGHNGLCRKCHSNFSFLLDIEEKFGEDAYERFIKIIEIVEKHLNIYEISNYSNIIENFILEKKIC